MKYLFLICPFLLALSGCKQNFEDTDQPPSLNPQPVTVPLNTSGGYILNRVTGDSIRPIINSYGDTVMTGIPIPAKGKEIFPEKENKPVVVKAPSKNHLESVKANTNYHPIPEDLTFIHISMDSLPKILVPLVEPGDTSHYILNSTGAKVSTGIKIPVKSRVVSQKRPYPVAASLPDMKENAVTNIQYLDVGHGMTSTYVSCVIEDRQNYIWFGTWGGGVSVYDGSSFIHFTKKEGLGDNIILCLMEDRNGNIWSGTDGGGVSVFDGNSFEHFSEAEGLSHNEIDCMLEDRRGHIWLGTGGGGVILYDGESLIHYTKKEGLSHNHIRSIAEDKMGIIWIATDGGGVNIFNGNSFTHFTEAEGLISNRIRSIFEDQKGNIWFGSENKGVSIYDGYSFTNLTEKEGLSSNRVRSIIEDQKGNIWIATDGGGVNLYDGDSFTHFREKDGLSHNSVGAIARDTKGNLWFGTQGGGVILMDQSSFTHFTKKEGLSNNIIISAAEDEDGHLWFGTYGGGVNIFDGESISFLTVEGGLKDSIHSIKKDRKGNLWLGTQRGGVCKNDGEYFTFYTVKNGLSSDNIRSITEDRNGNLWFATIGGGVTRFDGNSFIQYTETEGLSSNNIRSVIEDGDGNVWFATDGSGVTKFDGQHFIHFTEKEGLNSNTVLSILEDQRGYLWIGTWGGGVSVFDGKNFFHFTEDHGLSNNIVWSLAEDPGGQFIWAGTEKGLNCLEFRDKIDDYSTARTGAENDYVGIVVKNLFQINDGLRSMDFVQNSAFIDSKKRAWWGTGKGLVMLDLSEFNTPETPPEVYLKRVDIDGQFVDYRNDTNSSDIKLKFSEVEAFFNYPVHLELPYKHNYLTFYFSGLDWSAPHKVKYSHRIKELGNSWSLPSAEAKAEYRNHPFGSYTFQVRAIGESREWSDPAEFQFTIHPPWWHTNWAYGLYALFVVFLGWRIHLFQQSRMLRKERDIARERDLEQAREIEKAYNELQEAQDQLVQQEKLASLGQLTAAIAHEIKNPLNFVNNFSELSEELVSELVEAMNNGNIDEALEISQDIAGNLRIIHQHGSRADTVVKSMLQHSRGGDGKIVPSPLNTLVKEYVNLAFHGMRAQKDPINVDIIMDLDPMIGDVSLVPEDFSRVVVNICKNAFDAMKVKKQEMVKSGQKFKPELKVITNQQDNSIAIVIQDNGTGIPEEIRDKILEPFFTTKKGTQGTGLGLSITNDIVKAHGGKLKMETITGQYTQFRIIMNK